MTQTKKIDFSLFSYEERFTGVGTDSTLFSSPDGEEILICWNGDDAQSTVLHRTEGGNAYKDVTDQAADWCLNWYKN